MLMYTLNSQHNLFHHSYKQFATCTTTFTVLPVIGLYRDYGLQVRVQVARFRFQYQAGRQDSHLYSWFPLLPHKYRMTTIWGMGAWGSAVVKGLRYYSDGPRIGSLWCHWIFQWHIPSDNTMALGSTQPVVKMITRNIPGGKGGRWVRLTTSPLSRVECHEIWEPKPPGTLWVTPGLLRDSFLPIIWGIVAA